MRSPSTRAWGRAGWLMGVAVALGLAPGVAQGQDLPPLEVLLEEAKTAEDSLAIQRSYEAATGMRAERPGEEAEDRAPEEEGETPVPGVGVPEADLVYRTLVGEADTSAAAAGRGPITYQSDRLVFYPGTEVIVMEGEAAAEQAGTELRARRILYRSREGVVEAFEEATVSRGESVLGADSLFYDRETGAVATFGASILTEGTSETRGVDLRYDLERRSGRLGGGVTTYEPWILEGQAMSKIGESTFMLEDGYFTTCDLEDPHYTFRADEIKLRQDDVIVARPVVLYFSDIPVFYLPWYVEPGVKRGRNSGFLRPKIGLNSLIFGSGKERNVQDIGYYYVFNEYADAKVSADWYTESRFVLRGDVRYHVRHEFRGSANVEQVWNRLDDSTSRLLRLTHDQEFGLQSRLNVDVNWSNSRSFLRRNSFDPEEILQRSFRSAASYSTRFDWGSLVAGADADFQLESNRIDFRLPDLRLSINQRPLWGRQAGVETGQQPWYQRLQYSANASFVSRLSRAQVDSLGNPVSRVPTDSLGRPIETDRETVENRQEGRSQFTLSGPLDLFGVVKANPSLSYAVSVENDALAEDETLGGRGQMGAGMNLSTRFFRIFRSVPGPWFTAMRHTVAPSASFNYSPKPQFFGGADESSGNDSFTANFSLGQDFEVKIPVGDEPESGEEADGEREDTGVLEDEVETRTVKLLSVTNSMRFDFLRQWEEGQLGFGDLSTRLSSDIGRDFSISMNMDHELVERGTGDEEDHFSPFLSRITTDFSIRRGGASTSRRREAEDGEGVLAGRGADEQTEEAQESLVAGRAAGAEGFGPWSLRLTHQWSRNRDGDGNRQSLGIGAQMLPTPNWSLNYQTTYDITDGELQGQTLSLARDLHDWQATLSVNVFPSEPQDRVLISFSVFLRDVPDFEIPYRVRRE